MINSFLNTPVNIGAKTNEPTLAELVKKYYSDHFDEATAAVYTQQYLEKISDEICNRDGESYDEGYADGSGYNP